MMGKKDKTGTDSKSTAIEIEETRDNAVEPDKETEMTEEGRETEDPLETAKREAAENYDRLLRASAEFDNYKKRTAKEMSDLRKYATEALCKDLLNILDNLERAVESANAETQGKEGVLEGVELTIREMLKVLEKNEVRPIDPMGQPFDPTYHQALMQQESDEHPENTVVGVVQKGYTIHDRLLRPALVAVSTSKSAKSGGHK